MIIVVLKAFTSAKAKFLSSCSIFSKHLQQTPTYINSILITPHTHFKPFKVASLLIATMFLSRVGFRLLKAATSVIGWHAQARLEPFSVPDIEKIPAFRDQDRATSTLPHWMMEQNDANRWSNLWRIPFGDPSRNPLKDFGMFLEECNRPAFLYTSSCNMCSPISQKILSIRPSSLPDLLFQKGVTNSEGSVVPDRTPNTESGESTSTSIEDTPMIPHAVHLMALAEKDAIEEAIRREADPRGMISRNSIDTAAIVKYIRKRQRDGMEERRRDQNTMRIEKEDLQHRFDDEKERLHRIIRGQNEVMRARDEQGQQISDDYCEVQFKYKDLLEDNKAKNNRITELEEKAKERLDTYQMVNQSSVEALKRADRQMEYRIDRIKIKYEQELGGICAWNQELQDRLNIARRLQPVILLHRAQVGTVCEMHEKLLQLKKSKMDELAVKEKENEELRIRNDLQQEEINDLKDVATADGKVLRETATLLSNTRKALSEAEGRIMSHQREEKTLNKWGREWENRYRAKDEACTSLKVQMNILKADQHKELIRAKAQNGILQKCNGFL